MSPSSGLHSGAAFPAWGSGVADLRAFPVGYLGPSQIRLRGAAPLLHRNNERHGLMVVQEVGPMFGKRFVVGIVVGALSILGTAHAATSPEQQCQSSKNKSAGKYAACRQGAESKLSKTPATAEDLQKYADALTKCGTKFTDAWSKAIGKAAEVGATCTDSPLTAVDFQSVIDDHTDNVASALAGGGLLHCGNGVIDFDEPCDQNNLNGSTCVSLGFSFGALACGPDCVLDTTGCYSPPRFGDNGDGTVTDHQTGLMWEKKADLDIVPVSCTSAAVCPDAHDADNLYTWTDNDTPTDLPTGTAFTVFLSQLNAGGGFAGYTDWRLPTLAELSALIDYDDATSPLVNVAFDSGCTGSCSTTTCSCTVSDRYWSNSSVASAATDAWVVDPGNGEIVWDTKDTDYAVRAVRTIP